MRDVKLRHCRYPGCPNRRTPASSKHKSFHLIPHLDTEVRRLWLTALKIDPNSTIEQTKAWVVCSDHFEREDFYPKEPQKDQDAALLNKRPGLRPPTRPPKKERRHTWLRPQAVPRTTLEMPSSDGCPCTTDGCPCTTDGWMPPISEAEAGYGVLPEQEERNSSLVKEEPEPPQIKEEQEEELLQRPDEAARSALTLLAVKSDDENTKTEPLASTSAEHMKTQAYIEYRVPSEPASDDHQLLQQEMNPSLVQVKLEDPQIKGEQQEINLQMSNSDGCVSSHSMSPQCSPVHTSPPRPADPRVSHQNINNISLTHHGARVTMARGNAGNIQPYVLEPEANSSDEGDLVPEVRMNVDVSEWCSCGNCRTMDTPIENRCCQDVPEVLRRMNELDQPPICMTLHPGLKPVCMDPFSLQNALNIYKANNGPLQTHQEYAARCRYLAYRMFVSWVWGYLGPDDRRVLPSCIALRFCQQFPDAEEDYVGFRPPLGLEA